jgi:hypothetical protein
MALKSFHRTFAISFILFLLASFIPMRSAQALNSPLDSVSLPSLSQFADQIKNNQDGELSGIYVPDILAARIVQQPKSHPEFVSTRQNILTQFDLASQFGSTGLLAHNYLAGESFSYLKENQKFYLIYGDGQIAAFVVTEILRYQALSPTNPSSKFIDLANNDTLTASELFSRIYERPGQVILQTCIAAENNSSWGRLFVIAKPYSQKP